MHFYHRLLTVQEISLIAVLAAEIASLAAVSCSTLLLSPLFPSSTCSNLSALSKPKLVPGEKTHNQLLKFGNSIRNLLFQHRKHRLGLVGCLALYTYTDENQQKTR